MGLPQLLLVDDSEAVLAYERAALRDRYALSTARDGLDALEQLERDDVELPALIVLDLSMPRLNGEELIERLRADARLRDVPVLVVSSEAGRARALVGHEPVVGALAKPLEATTLRATVERVLEEARLRRARSGLTVVRVAVGPRTFALPLSAVRRVIAQPLCTSIAGAPPFLDELVDLHGEPVVVFDLARRLGVAPRVRYVDRSLVVVDVDDRGVAVAVDAVVDPEFVAKDDIVGDDVRIAAHKEGEPLLVPLLRLASFVDAALLRSLDVRGGATA